jgi:adenylosuccinate synthase
MRENGVLFAKNIPELAPYVHEDVIGFLRHQLDKQQRVLIEGTQGYGLSVLHSPYYPCATSRDTTAGTFIAEAGLSPLDVDEVVLTLRAFPIRVGGPSGQLPHEISWADVAREADEPLLMEYTTVTKKPRRVARFDPVIVRKAIAINQPTKIVMNHLDYLGKGSVGEESRKVFVKDVEALLGRKIDLLGVDPRALTKNLN